MTPNDALIDNVFDIARSYFIDSAISEEQFRHYIHVTITKAIVEHIHKSCSNSDVTLQFATAIANAKAATLPLNDMNQPGYCREVVRCADRLTDYFVELALQKDR